MNIYRTCVSMLVWTSMSMTLLAAPPELPAPISAGFALLQQGRVKDAIFAWGEGSAWTNQQEFVKATTMVLGVEPVSKGPLSHMEEIARVSLTPSVSLYWIALIYERGVHYLWFEVLAQGDAQVITSMSRYDDVREMGASLAIFLGQPVGIRIKDSD